MNHRNPVEKIVSLSWQGVILLSAAIVSMSLFSMLSFNSFAQTQDDNQSITDTNSTNWKTYENKALGVSFAYPAEWDIVEKENRFDTGPDVTVSDGSTKFVVSEFDQERNGMLQSTGLAESTKALEDAIANVDGMTVIEGTDLKKYKVGGERTATFLMKAETTAGDIATETFVVAPKGKGYMLTFHDSTLTFDDPETQNILNKILQSFKFLV